MTLAAIATPRAPATADMAGAADDRQLLEVYVAQRSHAAFAEIVRRHAPFVYAFALRKTRDSTAAEDVTQTVFCLLARKAASVGRRPLPGWLFAATRYAASNELRSAARRRRHEQGAARPEATSRGHDATDPALACLLDEGLERLSRAERDAVLLRYFQGLDGPAVARALGVSDDAARRRLARAVERLRRFFTAAGATLSPSLLARGCAAPSQVSDTLAGRVRSAALAPPPATLEAARHLHRSIRRVDVRVLLPMVAAAVVIAAGGFALQRAISQRRGTADAVSPPPRLRRPGLGLALAWNRQLYPVPMPPTFPNELRDSAPYRDWLSRRDARTFTWATRDGRTYVCHAEILDEAATRTAYISRVQLLRADGTLEREAVNDPTGAPRSWHVYGPDGKTRLATFANSPADSDGGPFVHSVLLYDPDGARREYRSNRNGTVYAEWLLDAQGRHVRLLNGGERYNDARGAADAPGG